jgi:hypothetical protein
MKYPLLALLIAACSPPPQRTGQPTLANRLLGDSKPPRGRITLERLRSVELDEGAQVRGAAFGPGDSIVYWTAREVFTLGPELERPRRRCSPFQSRPMAAAFGSSSRDVEVIDSAGRLIVSDGSACRRMSLDTGGRLLSAARSTNGWVGLVRPSAASPPIVIDLARVRSRRIEPLWPPLKPGDEDWLFVTPSDKGVVVGMGRPPFWWSRINAADSPELIAAGRTVSEPLYPVALAAADADPAWASKTVLTTKYGFLQTLADLKSEARVLVRYDSTGRVVSTSRISAPLGLVASSPNSDLVLGFASLKRPTLILYRLTGGH